MCGLYPVSFIIYTAVFYMLFFPLHFGRHWLASKVFIRGIVFRRRFTASGSCFPIQSMVACGSSFQNLLHGVKGHFVLLYLPLQPQNARKTGHRLPDGQERLTTLKNFQQCYPQLALLHKVDKHFLWIFYLPTDRRQPIVWPRTYTSTSLWSNCSWTELIREKNWNWFAHVPPKWMLTQSCCTQPGLGLTGLESWPRQECS